MNRYDKEYWASSPDDRLRVARRAYLDSEAALARSRSRLLPRETTTVLFEAGGEIPSPFPGGRSFTTEDVKVELSNELQQRHRWNQYLIDFERYVRAKMEYERLEREGRAGRLPTSTEHRGSSARVGGTENEPAPDPRWAIREEVLRHLYLVMRRAKDQPSTESARDLVVEAAHAQVRGLDNDPMVVQALQEAGSILEELDRQAEATFRQSSTSRDYAAWKVKQAVAQSVGRSEPRDPLRGVRRLRPPGRYLVQPGDSLSGIAEKFYGEASRWDAIYELNRPAIGPDPDRILPLTMLDIP